MLGGVTHCSSEHKNIFDVRGRCDFALWPLTSVQNRFLHNYVEKWTTCCMFMEVNPMGRSFPMVTCGLPTHRRPLLNRIVYWMDFKISINRSNNYWYYFVYYYSLLQHSVSAGWIYFLASSFRTVLHIEYLIFLSSKLKFRSSSRPK